MRVKGPVLVALALALAPSAGLAQRVEISPFGGFQFGGDLDIESGELNVPLGGNYGVLVDITVAPNGQIELIYNRQATELEQEGAGGATTPLFDMAVHYVHVGALYQFPSPQVAPFVTVSGGVSRFEPSGDRDAESYVSGSFGGGLKKFVTPNFGFRVQSRFWFTLVRSNDAVFCAPPAAGGCLIGQRSGLLVQGNLTGGLIVAF
jgi:hypothetical protein